MKQEHLLLTHFFTNKIPHNPWVHIQMAQRKFCTDLNWWPFHCAAVLTVMYYFSLTFASVCSVKVPWNSCSWAQDHGKTSLLGLSLAGLLWCFSAGPSWAPIHQRLVGPQYSDLYQIENSQTMSCGPLVIKCWTERGKHLDPTSITAHQTSVTTRQRSNSKYTRRKYRGSNWSLSGNNLFCNF